MDFIFFGTLDILLILLAFLILFIGYKTGILLSLVKIASNLFGFLAAVFFAQPLANVLRDLNIGIRIRDRVEAYLISKSPEISEAIIGESGVVTEHIENLGFPQFLANFLIRRVDSLGPEAVEASLLRNVSPILTNFLLIVIAFLLIFIGSKIIFFFLKIIVIYFREVPLIRITDGIAGALFFSGIGVFVLFIALFILDLLLANNILPANIHQFFIIELQLETEQFRLTKFFFENNFVGAIIHIFI
ncbi:MAG: CvpA family protein [Erysipelotrichales bacterium]|nr:CvpA family protein [Erysipelotrichales bacterium]